jgi:hypothetical protein
VNAGLTRLQNWVREVECTLLGDARRSDRHHVPTRLAAVLDVPV